MLFGGHWLKKVLGHSQQALIDHANRSTENSSNDGDLDQRFQKGAI